MKTTPTLAAQASSVTSALNLATASRGASQGLTLAPQLTPVIQGNMRILAHRRVNGVPHTLMLDLDEQTFMITDGTNTQDAGTPDAEVFGAAISIGGFVVMTSRGLLSILRNEYGGWYIDETSIASVPITFEARHQRDYTLISDPFVIPAADLPRDTGLISSARVHSIGANLSEEYFSLADRIASRGYWMQPLIVRYHLINDQGRRFYTSPPSLVDYQGWQACDILSVDCSKAADGSLNLPALRFPVSAFSLGLRCHGKGIGSYRRLGISSVEICVSPLIHPVDSQAETPCRVVRPTSATPSLTIAIPGTTDRFESLDASRADRLFELLPHLDAIETSVAVIPLDKMTQDLSLSRPLSLTRSVEESLLSKVLKTTVQPVVGSQSSQALIDRIAPPNAFVAEACCADADTLLWGNITPLRWLGADIHTLCSDFVENQPWNGVLQLTRTDGTSTAVELSGPHRPLRLASCISFPDPSVASLRLFINSAAGRQVASATLLPTPDNRFAARISLDIPSRDFYPYSGIFPAISSPWQPQETIPGALVASHISAPALPISATICSTHPIKAITPAVRSASAWDFSRSHLYAFTSAGIYAVSVAASSVAIKATCIDPRGVDSQSAVCFTPAGVMALSSGSLLSVATSSVKTLLTDAPYDTVVWHPPLNALYLRDHLGNITMLMLDSLRHSQILTPVDIRRLFAIPPLLWACSDTQVLMPDLTGDLSDPSRPFEWRWSPPEPPPHPLSMLQVDLSASLFHGTIKLYGSSWPQPDAASLPGQLLAGAEISGQVNAPIRLRITPPARSALTLVIRGDASPDLFLRSISLT